MIAFVIESWTWYSVATLLFLMRLIARILHRGSVLKLQVEDWLMVVTFCFYSVDIGAVNVVAHSETNLLPPGYLETHVLTPEEIDARRLGSKMNMVVEQTQCVTVWLCKCCMLILYHRITKECFTIQNRLVKLLGCYVVFTYILMVSFWFGLWCRPFSGYWTVPSDNVECTACIKHLITNAVFNLTSDLAMLCIALPMFIRTHLPLQRKIGLISIFGFGLFTIVCAVLNKFYSFSQPFGTMWVYWYTRECSTCMIVANLPYTWGIVRRIFGLRDATDSASSGALSRTPSEMSKRSSMRMQTGVTSFGGIRQSSSPAAVSNGLSLDEKKHMDFSVGEADIERAETMSTPLSFDEMLSFGPEYCRSLASRYDTDDSVATLKTLRSMEKALLAPDRHGSHGSDSTV